jgi:NADH dehydrogenase/NADH:ubiquinone oxidoreductase subunit G
MGVCQDCRVTIEGRPGVPACTAPVAEGMRIDLASGDGDG